MPVLTIDDDNLNRREVETKFIRGARTLPVSHMFDDTGSETFDPTDAVEIESDGNLLELQDGDQLVMAVTIEFLSAASSPSPMTEPSEPALSTEQ